MTEPFQPRVDTEFTVDDPAKTIRRVVAVALPGSDPLEFIGPLEVLRTANIVLAAAGLKEQAGYDIVVAAPKTGTACEWPGMTISVDRELSSLTAPIDTILVSAMDWEEACLSDLALLDWLSEQGGQARRVCGICTGAYVLAAAGLLDGRRATTHWAWCGNLATRYPDVRVDSEPIYVVDGPIRTSAGATSCLDLALALVEEDFGREVALRVAQFLVLYLKRPGGQEQFSVHVAGQFAERNAIRELQTWIMNNLGENLSVEALAERARMSTRNFARVFARETGVSPGKYVEQCRFECARHRLVETQRPVKAIAAECGYRTLEAMRVAFMRHAGVSPSAYRSRFATSAR